MELFYNPERMTETEVRETFVAHQWLVDEILSILNQQPQGAGVQHAIIIAPRGMGKTTVLLMLRFSILGSELHNSWQPVLFPEESYHIYDLADFWIAVLNHLSVEIGDESLSQEVSQLENTHRGNRELEEAALATIRDWRKKTEKRLLTLVDSFDLILGQIGDEADHAKLRDVLMNDGTMMLIGGATAFFKEARAYDQPLYNLFKIYNLQSLNSDQIHDLLRRRAKLDGVENFDEQLRQNASRIRVLEYFTGGNPRLVMMLYRVITRSQVSEVKRGLEKLLDEVTPYYKAKVENLPAQQRKILDHIARISARTREGLTPSEIATSTRLTVNQVSAQLIRLVDIGYVRAANVRGRSSYYTLSEPLYAIWHQMRFGREARERMNWLVAFLRGWYDAEEINWECQRLQDTFEEYLTMGRFNEARDVLEHRRYLVSALDEHPDRAVENIILSYLQLDDVDTLKREVLPGIDFEHLTGETKLRLEAAGLKPKKRYEDDQRAGHSETLDRLLKAGLESEDPHRRIAILRQAVELEPTSIPALVNLCITLANLGDIDEALVTLKKAETQIADASPLLFKLRAFRAAYSKNFDEVRINLDKLSEAADLTGTWIVVGAFFVQVGEFDHALRCFSRVIEIDVTHAEGWKCRAVVLSALDRHEEAVESFDRALQLAPEENQTWFFRGRSLMRLERYEEALQSIERASELDPNFYDALLLRSHLLNLLGRHEEALAVTDNLLKPGPSSFDALFLRAYSLAGMKRTKESLETYKQAFSIVSDEHRELRETLQALYIKLILSVGDGNLSEAVNDWEKFSEIAKQTLGEARWLKAASVSLRSVAFINQDFARELIRTSNLEEPLFPLARALDYLATDDETLIEKLSPEVKKIVEEIVETLKESSKRPKPTKGSRSSQKRDLKRGATKRRKSKSGER